MRISLLLASTPYIERFPLTIDAMNRITVRTIVAALSRRSLTSSVAVATVLAAIALVPARTFTQSAPTLATDITASEVQAVLNAPSPIADRLIRAVDMGTYNVGVGVLRRGKTTPGAPFGAINHERITEVYYWTARTNRVLLTSSLRARFSRPRQRSGRLYISMQRSTTSFQARARC